MADRWLRFLSRAVVALLAANALAVPFVLRDAVRHPHRDRPDVSGRPSPSTVAVVTTSDGRHYLADPTTAAGRRAIAEVRRTGGSVHRVTLAPGTVPRTSGSAAGGSRSRRPDLGAVVRQLGHTGARGGLAIDPETTITTTDSGGSGGGDDGSVVPIGLDDLARLVGPTLTTVTSVVNGTATTASSVLQGTATTVGSLVGGVVTTVSSVVQSVVTTVPAPSTTAVPTTVPPPVTTTSICVVTVHC